MSLKQKTVDGLLWSFIDQFAYIGITFIASIILARLLSPSEFGLIGMITVFIAVSESFINSGFSSALIRKKDCTDTDYSTVFYFNLVVGILFFNILFFSASAIAKFFNEPQLKAIVQVLSVVLIIDSLSLIQRTILTKRVDFKLQARISIIASVVSGIIAVSLAFAEFGVWSLVAQRISKQGINSYLLWIWNRWRPLSVFSKKSFGELFGFGSKLLISGLIDALYRNIYYLVIGKFFSAQELGYYTRADEFKRIPSQNLNLIIGRVSYPVLSSIQEDKSRLKSNYQRLIRSTMLVTLVLMLGMAAVAEPMVITLIGEKWRPSIIYLQMLCFVGMMYPINSLNMNVLQVQGRSDLFLRLEVIKKILAVPTIILGVFMGIKIMIVGLIFNSIIAYYLNSYWSGLLIGYSFREQIKDIIPTFILAVSIAIPVYFAGVYLPYSFLAKLIIQIIFGIVLFFGICEIVKIRDYIYIKQIFIENFIKKKSI